MLGSRLDKLLLPYCCQSSVDRVGTLSFLWYLQVKRRADERTRTAFLLQLRVITQALQGCAEDCKCRIFRGVSSPCLAPCCTVLRSRWCQREDVSRFASAARVAACSCKLLAGDGPLA
jgi:hypothetical protein